MFFSLHQVFATVKKLKWLLLTIAIHSVVCITFHAIGLIVRVDVFFFNPFLDPSNPLAHAEILTFSFTYNHYTVSTMFKALSRSESGSVIKCSVYQTTFDRKIFHVQVFANYVRSL